METNNAALNQTVDAMLSAQEKDAESAAERLLELTQNNDLFAKMVEDMKRRHGGVVHEARSSEFLQWKHGLFRLSVQGARLFTWEDGGESKSCPVLDCTVLDGDTRAGKALIGKPVIVGVHYEIAKAICDAVGSQVTDPLVKECRTRSASVLCRRLVSDPELRKFIESRCSELLAYVACDKDGVPLKKDIKGSHRMMADSRVAIG